MYLQKLAERFSEVLRVDELYQGKLAILIAVNPADERGDRLIGYQLLDELVDGEDARRFL